TNGLGFFNQISQVNAIISQSKKKNSLSQFTAADDVEICRGMSYAAFPELVELVNEGGQITVDGFRSCLKNRGIDDLAFQNKILNMTLQTREGVQYAAGRIIDTLLLDNQCYMWMLRDFPYFKIELEVDDNNSINLIFNGTWEAFVTEDPTGPRENAVKACVKINISREMVAITSFELTQLSDNPSATRAFELLEANQQNILMKLITFIQHAFGYNCEFRLEEQQEDDQSWPPT
ncbi:TPA: hypothetical protein ACPSKF_003158, partial [Legionella anisa]